MEATSNGSKGFTDEYEEEEDFGKRDARGSTSSVFHKELTVRVDGESNSDQKSTMLRSKHSVTEQRRRSKINERFQILRDLIPHSDQKRDKASFLSEVIEYIQFLQEKVRSYESVFAGQNQENTNLTPWVKVLFRSFWEKAQKKSKVTMDELNHYAQQIKNGGSESPSGFIFSGVDTDPAGQCMLQVVENPVQYGNVGSGLVTRKETTVSVSLQPCGSSGNEFFQPQTLISDFQNLASASPTHLLRSGSSEDCELNNDEGLTFDDGTISVSNAYSQGLLHVLTQTLESSGVNLSQTRISVQISLGKRMLNGNTFIQKCAEDPNPASEYQVFEESQVVGSTSGNELVQVQKRHKPCTS